MAKGGQRGAKETATHSPADLPPTERGIWISGVGKSNLALVTVNHQLQFILDELAYTPHYTLCRLL